MPGFYLFIWNGSKDSEKPHALLMKLEGENACAFLTPEKEKKKKRKIPPSILLLMVLAFACSPTGEGIKSRS